MQYIKKLNPYLHNATLTIYTDHKPKEYLLNSPIQNKKMQTWALSMNGCDCKIQYLKGEDNICADLLSRGVDESKNNNDPPVDIDNRNYGISAINSNLFEPKKICLMQKCQRPSDDVQTTFVEKDRYREQKSNKNIFDLKSRIKNDKVTK